MANKEKKKVPFDRQCFEELLEIRKISIRKLGAVDKIGWSEKSYRRALKEEKISPDLLDLLAEYLDIDPDYLSGKYHKEAKKYKDPYIRAWSLFNLKAERYPYLLKLQRDKSDGRFLYDRYLENILIIHDISPKQFADLPFETQKKMQYELEDGICKVLLRFFEKNALSNDTASDIYMLQNDIENYEPNYEEPPEEFFKEMMNDSTDPFAEKYKDYLNK